MGQRSRSEAVVGVFQAFLAQRTWLQPDLARHLEVQVSALKKILDELTNEGMPLDREEESTNVVYWSVPPNWFPGAVYFTGEEVKVLLRQLAFLPESEERNRLMDVASRATGGHSSASHVARSIVVMPERRAQPKVLETVYDATKSKVAIRCRYFSQKKGREKQRHLSIQRLVGDQRFIAVCHDSKKLKWFRVDNLIEAKLDAQENFRPAPVDEVDALLSESINGFRGAGEVREYRFFVDAAEAGWVSKNLPEGMRVEDAEEGIHVIAKTAGVLQVARYVLSLGGVAVPETEELVEAVAELANRVLTRVHR